MGLFDMPMGVIAYKLDIADQDRERSWPSRWWEPYSEDADSDLTEEEIQRRIENCKYPEEIPFE